MAMTWVMTLSTMAAVMQRVRGLLEDSVFDSSRRLRMMVLMAVTAGGRGRDERGGGEGEIQRGGGGGVRRRKSAVKRSPNIKEMDQRAPSARLSMALAMNKQNERKK